MTYNLFENQVEQKSDAQGPSSSSQANGEDAENVFDDDDDEDDDDELDLDELNELEASLAKTSIKIQEPGEVKRI